MRKYFFVILTIASLIAIGFWSPWLNWNLSVGKIIGLGENTEFSGLRVFSIVGDVDVYVEGTFEGTLTPVDGALEVTEIEPGDRTVRIVRKSEPANTYYEFEKDINFEAGVDVIISYELGTNKEFSEGHVFYATKNFTSENQGSLNIISQPISSNVYLDDEFIGTTPISTYQLDLDKTYNIRLEKEGYETISFNILPDSQDDRDKLKGYTLNLDVNMFLVPLNIQKIEQQDGESED